MGTSESARTSKRWKISALKLKISRVLTISKLTGGSRKRSAEQSLMTNGNSELLKKVKKDDLIICAEFSRLGRNLFMIMEILNICMTKECKVWTIKDNYRLGEDIQSKVLAFAFGLSAEIERNLISQRTKEALARKRSEGVVLGRPKGCKSSHVKLTGKEETIRVLREQHVSKSEIARIFGVHRMTVDSFIKKNHLDSSEAIV